MIDSRIIQTLTKFIFGFIELILGLRIILKLFGANPLTPFVAWVYETSQPLLEPFEGMFPTQRVSGGFILEVSVLFALLAYVFLAYVVEELVLSVGRRGHHHK